MEHTEVQDAVRAWLDSHSVNPATGVPPDAKVGVIAHRISTFGETALGADDPAAGHEQWSVTATLYFPDEEDDLRPKITRILERFQTALATHPGLPGRVELVWRGTGDYPFAHLDAPLGYPSAVDVLLAVRVAPA